MMILDSDLLFGPPVVQNSEPLLITGIECLLVGLYFS